MKVKVVESVPGDRVPVAAWGDLAEGATAVSLMFDGTIQMAGLRQGMPPDRVAYMRLDLSNDRTLIVEVDLDDLYEAVDKLKGLRTG